MDKLNPFARSQVMAAIRSKGNKSTELRFRGMLVRAGVKGWKVQASEVLGKPDFVFPKKRMAIFVDSCYWHGCPKHVRLPKSRKAYWLEKLEGNAVRDRRVSRDLKKQGWRVLRIWEHDLIDTVKLLARLKAALQAC